ncbi:MAG: hypothetical protein ABI853_02680 [Sphingomicrobium sp.]
MKLLTASLVGLAVIASPVLAQETNNTMATEQKTTTVDATTRTTHVHGTVPRKTPHKRHRHHKRAHHHHVVKKTTTTTTTKS